MGVGGSQDMAHIIVVLFLTAAKPVFSDRIKQDIFQFFSDRWLLIADELSALLSCSNKQAPVISDVHVTCIDGHLKQV